MNLTNEAEVVQNFGLGALALWAFTKEFHEEKRRNTGPQLQIAALILPMVFHEETLDTIRTRRFDGGFFTALAQNRGISVELEERAQSMLPQTMASLNLAFATRLLTYRQDLAELRPLRQTPPYALHAQSSRRIVSACERLGYWFATINTPQMCSLLNVHF